MTVGTRRGARVRVHERFPGGPLQLTTWTPGRGARTRTLGHRDRAQARIEAEGLVAQRERRLGLAPPPTPRPPTLLTLLARYLVELRYADDGSLKTRRYLDESRRRAKYLVGWFRRRLGREVLAADVTVELAREYARARREGLVNGRPVRTRSIQADLRFLKSALAWGVTAEHRGAPYLQRNRLAGWHPPREQDTRRPLIADATITALVAVAPRVHPRLTLLILLLETTGRRLSSVLGLRWDDLDFARGVIRWRGVLDKKRRTQDAPMPTRAARALAAERAAHPAIGGALLFPSRRDSAVPVSRHVAADWLKRAYRYAGLSRPPGGLWHPFRRKWATERKHHPVRDLAEAGGWKDVQTLLTCYVQADLDTMREVVEQPQRRRASPGVSSLLTS